MFANKPSFEIRRRQFVLLAVYLLILSTTASGHAREWAWMRDGRHGGIYGTRGTPAPENEPGSRTSAATWTDHDGNLWMFGGTGRASYDSGLLNDLWKYNPTTDLWTWVKGSDRIQQQGVYGVNGVSHDDNTPGARRDSVSWTDAEGNLWLFGGYGYGTTFSSSSLNDLWKYDIITNQWIWVSGSNTTNQYGIYGVQGVGDSANTPGARHVAAGWTDSGGNFWLFGGTGKSATLGTYLNDLWKYDVSAQQWIWIKGSSTTRENGVYGDINTSATANTPGSRIQSTTWTDNADNLWLFGGYGYAPSGLGRMNDVWKFDPATSSWTWVKGSSSTDAAPVYGTRGVPADANTPSARDNAISWRDQSGDLWLMGGYYYGSLNDLWRLNPESRQWTWMGGSTGTGQSSVYGTRKVFDAVNWPGSRFGAFSWIDMQGKFWLLGGEASTASGRYFGELWQFDPQIEQWAWMHGRNVNRQYGVSGAQGFANPDFVPKGRSYAVSSTDPAGKLWLFSGTAFDTSGNGGLSDLWSLDPETRVWTWEKGTINSSTKGDYGIQGVSDPSNMPGGRKRCSAWTDLSGRFWIFGGTGTDSTNVSGRLNDLWVFDPITKMWTWKKGSNIRDQADTYGQMGVAADTNSPGGRYGSISWTDNAGNLWLMGGYRWLSDGVNILNDLWKYTMSTNQWTWMGGSPYKNQPGLYGTKGQPSQGNMPGGRYDAVTWTDTSGALWLFGGIGYGASTTSGYRYLNDLWRYDTVANTWTWISGSNTGDQVGIYGIKTIPASANMPGGRSGAVGWNDPDENLWLFGGYGKGIYTNAETLNDLWKYDPKTGLWTWVNGAATTNGLSTHGAQGNPSSENTPSARLGAAGWADTAGDFWLFGGDTIDFEENNDLWRLSPAGSSVETWELY